MMRGEDEEFMMEASESLSELAFQMELELDMRESEEEGGFELELRGRALSSASSNGAASSTHPDDAHPAHTLRTRWYLPATSVGSARRAKSFEEDFSLSGAAAVTPPGSEWWHAFAPVEGSLAKELRGRPSLVGTQENTAGSTPSQVCVKALAGKARLPARRENSALADVFL